MIGARGLLVRRLAATRRIMMALVLPAVMASPAYAQFFDEPLSSREVRYAVEDYGYQTVGQPRRSGDTYVVDAIGTGGRKVRLVVDAYDGTLIRTRAVVPPSSRFGSLFGREPRLIPPRSIPGVGEPDMPHKAPAKKTAARHDGDELKPDSQLAPRRRKPAEERSKNDKPGGTAALPQKPQEPVKAAPAKSLAKGSDEKPTASIKQTGKRPEKVDMVPPVPLDDVKPRKVGDPPPMPPVVPLE